MRVPTATSGTSDLPLLPYSPRIIADDDIFEPSGVLARGTTEISSGRIPRLLRSSLTLMPFSRVSSDTTRTSAPSMTAAGPYMSSMTNISYSPMVRSLSSRPLRRTSSGLHASREAEAKASDVIPTRTESPTSKALLSRARCPSWSTSKVPATAAIIG